MNFLDAHKILTDYIDVIASHHKGTVPFHRLSELKNTKDDIFSAYKLFVAHMIAFNTRNQEFYEKLDISLISLDMFISDSIVDQMEECQKILEDKSFFGRLKNKSAIPFAKEKLAHLMKQVPLETYFSKEKDDYTQAIFSEVEIFRNKIKSIPKDIPNRITYMMVEMNEYCRKVYKLANIPMDEDDVEYFYSFALLRELLKYPELAEFYAPYKDYILTHE